jgi:hypothetical protein
MSVGHEKEPLRSVIVFSPDWVRGFLNYPISYQPGTKFLYNTLATYMLSAIIQKVTGMTTLDYLKPRLLAPLHISGIDWEEDQKGVNVGGWGIRPAAWVEEATSKHIDQEPGASEDKRANGQYADWIQGYGYQFWRSRHGAFRGDGAYGQYILMMPEQDALLIITSESQDLPDDLNQVWKNLLPAFQAKPLASNPAALHALSKFNQTRQIKAPISSLQAPLPTKSYPLGTNPLDFQQINVNSKGTMTIISKDSVQHKFQLAQGKWMKGKSNLVGPYMLRAAKVDLAQKAPFDYAGSYRWLNAETLEITLLYFEIPHHWTFTLKGDQISVVNSFEPKTEIKLPQRK